MVLPATRACWWFLMGSAALGTTRCILMLFFSPPHCSQHSASPAFLCSNADGGVQPHHRVKMSNPEVGRAAGAAAGHHAELPPAVTFVTLQQCRQLGNSRCCSIPSQEKHKMQPPKKGWGDP